MTSTVLNTKIRAVENKIPDNSKCITTQEFIKLTAENFEARLKQGNLVNKSDFDNKLTSFNRRITLNKRNYLEVQNTLNSLRRKYYSFFLGRTYFTSNDGSQNTFVYQPTLELRKEKGSDYALSWKSKGVFNSKLRQSYTAFLNNIKHSEFRTGIKLDKNLLAIKQNNYLIKIANVYIVYDLDAWPRNPTNNFKFKNCLFGVAFAYSGYGIAFGSTCSWSFNNEFAKNVIIFGVDNSSSSYSDFLILGEGLTGCINGRFESPE